MTRAVACVAFFLHFFSFPNPYLGPMAVDVQNRSWTNKRACLGEQKSDANWVVCHVCMGCYSSICLRETLWCLVLRLWRNKRVRGAMQVRGCARWVETRFRRAWKGLGDLRHWFFFCFRLVKKKGSESYLLSFSFFLLPLVPSRSAPSHVSFRNSPSSKWLDSGAKTKFLWLC